MTILRYLREMPSIVACIGAGNVGRAWAIVFARAGHEVRLYDADPTAVPQRALPAIDISLADLAASGSPLDVAAVRARISACEALEPALDGATHIQESASENAALKAELFSRIDALAAPGAIIASSTSAIPGSRLFEHLPGRARCLVAHPVNPPYLIPLVELCPTPWTAAEVVDRCRQFMTLCGQRPVELKREITGFLLNRLQFALVGEALHLVGEGYCTPEDIDTVITAGLARRWAFIGPFEVGHLNATAGYAGFMTGLGDMVRSVTADVRPDYPWDQALVERIHARLSAHTPVEQIPARQAWRDRQLMAVARFLASLPRD
jgi:3-hydroxyacyl-CoA dehydrogenase